MRRVVEWVILDSEEDYRKEFEAVYVVEGFEIWGVPISFDKHDFDHIFYEPDNEGNKKGRFSKRRAKKMHFMRAILTGDFEKEVMFEKDRGTFAVFCSDLDCVLYLRVRVGSGKLQMGTFFDFGREHEKMLNKQKKKCLPITKEEFKKKIFGGY